MAAGAAERVGEGCVPREEAGDCCGLDLRGCGGEAVDYARDLFDCRDGVSSEFE